MRNKWFILFISIIIVSSLAYAASVTEIKSQGSSSSPAGTESWVVTCSSGKTVVVYKNANGEWATGFLGAMGSKYNSYSLNEIGEYVCNN